MLIGVAWSCAKASESGPESVNFLKRRVAQKKHDFKREPMT